ncbi:MAG: hypothetical protein M3Z23_03505 [Acidobacteriota bacterium]|nr:hypothetical protein [Acidobacteriota bacterium]
MAACWARLDVAERYADEGEAEAKSGNLAGGIGRLKKGSAIQHVAISDPREHLDTGRNIG